jgi:hypothetical protein
VKVWIVESGEQCEGGSVVGVYATETLARKAAVEVHAHFPGGWKPSTNNSWANGCDYVSIEEHEVIMDVCETCDDTQTIIRDGDREPCPVCT